MSSSRVSWGVVAAWLAAVAGLAGAATATPAAAFFERMNLTHEMTVMLFERAGTIVDREGGFETVALFCHVSEGRRCYFLALGETAPRRYDPMLETPERRLERDLAMRVTREIGVAFITHSLGKTVAMRCTRRAADADRSTACEIDRGGGWQPLPVR